MPTSSSNSTSDSPSDNGGGGLDSGTLWGVVGAVTGVVGVVLMTIFGCRHWKRR